LWLLPPFTKILDDDITGTILLKGNVPGFGGLAPHSAVVMTLAVNGIIRKNLSNKIV
jgi:hypothetical protein